jgi:hypothetical protein
VPEASQGVQAWDRYAYTNNNPLKYTDPSGHCPILIGAGIGAVFGGAVYGITTAISGREFSWGDFGVSVAVGAAGGALIGTGVGASAGVTALATIGAGTGVLGSQAGYSLASGQDFQSSQLVSTSVVGGVAGAVTGVLGGPAGINPIANPTVALGARMVVNSVSGVVDYSLASVIGGQTPTMAGVATSAGIGFVSGGIGEVFPSYQSRTLSYYGSQPYQRSFIPVLNNFNGSLRKFVGKELAFQAVDDVFRSGGIATFQNSMNGYLIAK